MRHAFDLMRLQRNFNPFFFADEAAPGMATSFDPAVDVDETESQFQFTFDMPGVKRDAVKIEVLGKNLVVSGERKQTRAADDGRTSHLTERAYGSFQRTFTLPTAIDADRIEAKVEDGVLHITVPKAEAAKPKLIQIKT